MVQGGKEKVDLHGNTLLLLLLLLWYFFVFFWNRGHHFAWFAWTLYAQAQRRRFCDLAPTTRSQNYICRHWRACVARATCCLASGLKILTTPRHSHKRSTAWCYCATLLQSHDAVNRTSEKT